MSITTLDATRSGDEEVPQQEPVQPTKENLESLERLIDKRDELPPARRAVVESLAKHWGVSLSPKRGFTQTGGGGYEPSETLHNIGQSIKQSALPVAGSVAGMAVPGPLAVKLAASGFLGVAGAKANKALGISNPDEYDEMLAAIAPTAGTAVGRAPRALPGSIAAKQQMAVPTMKAIPELLQGSREAVNLAYDEAKQAAMNARLPVKGFHQTINNLLGNEAVLQKYGLANPRMKNMLRQTMETLAHSPNGLPMKDINPLLKRYRELIEGSEAKGGETWGAYKALKATLLKDMDAAAAGRTTKAAGATAEAVQAQRAAMIEAKRNLAKEEITEVIGRYGTKMTEKQGRVFEVIEPTRVLNKLRDMGVPESLGKEWPPIEKALKELARVPHPESAMRAALGSSGRFLAMGAAGGAALLGGGGPLGAVGTAGVSYAAFKAHDAIARALMSDKGRQALVKVFKAQPWIDQTTGAMAEYIATQFQDEPPKK